MPIIRKGNSSFLGNAGRAAAAYGDTATNRIQESELRLKQMRDRREVAELERMRRIQSESAQREFSERQFAWQQQQGEIGANVRQQELDLSRQQQDRLDAQQYSGGLDSGVMSIDGQSVYEMRQRLGRIAPDMAEQFDEQWATMTAGEFGEVGGSPETYGDERHLRRNYKAVTALLGQAENRADAQARAAAPASVFDPLNRQYPGFLDTPLGQEFAAEVQGAYADPKYDLNAWEAEKAAEQMRLRGIGLARREHEREAYERRVLGWVTDTPEGMVIPEQEEIDALLDEIGTSNNPRQAYEKAERRFSPAHRKTELEARADERARMATAARIRYSRSLPGAGSMAAEIQAMAGGGVAPEPEKPVALPEDVAREKNLAERAASETPEARMWVEYLERKGVDVEDQEALDEAWTYWEDLRRTQKAKAAERAKLRKGGIYHR